MNIQVEYSVDISYSKVCLSISLIYRALLNPPFEVSAENIFE